jgi:archaellum component FlaC
MKEQWARLSRAVGNVFLPILQAVLPYINAVLMILTKVFNLLASLLGFKMPKFDYSGLAKVDDAVGDVVDGMNDVSDSAGNAGKAVDKLKDKMSGLRGFDKLNVINSPDDKGSSGTGAGGGGGGAGGGIDPAILDAFNDIFGKYDDMLDGIKMKATKIAEAFEAWATYLKPLEKPLKELAGLTYSGLIYVWNNVLKPLAKWTAYKLIPQLAKTTASALEVLVAVGKVLFKIYKMIYEVIVLPFARSIGNAIINSLKVASNILDAIAKSKVATTLLALVIAFTRLKTVANLFIKTKIGGYLSTFGSLLLEPIKGTRNLTTVWKNFISLVTPLKLKSITG